MSWFTCYGLILVIAWMVAAALSAPGLLHSVSIREVNRHQRNGNKTFRGDCPVVSVIIAARNEANALPRTLASLRDQTWPNIEVIAVNDRSSDDTGRILDEAALVWPELTVLHVAELPPKWLGKNYALQVASTVARGDWVLFTDADVRFSPSTVEAAMVFVQEHQIDHLSLAPRLISRGFWLKSVVLFFFYNVMLLFRPQDAANPKSRAFVGIGAFNLVRRSVYSEVKGHRCIAMRADDDLALGERIKRNGYRQAFAGGHELLEVEWYSSLRAMAHGLEKNALVPFRYRFGLFTLSMLAAFLFYDSPALGTLLVTGSPRWFFVLCWILQVCLFQMTRKYAGPLALWCLTVPLAAPVLLCILVRAAMLCLIRGGVWWRGTFYSLSELRQST